METAISTKLPMKAKKANPKVLPPQVFINFRGDELRDNFVNQLVRALREGEINVFIDVHELKGRSLNTLYTRIENSKIALAVFSKRYCESEWCLNELAKMSEEMKERKLMVIPIFYNVTANDVKRACNLDIEAEFKGEEGEFTILFKKMKEKHANDYKLVKRWELALKSVTQRIGLSTEVYRNSLIQSIVREVRRNLGMPQQKTMSVGDVSLWALWTSSVFAFIIAPLVFPNVNFFKTGKWVLGFPLMVLLWYTWDIDKRNTPLSFIRQRRRSTIWDRQNQNTPPAVNRQRRHCRICDSKNQNTQPAFDWKPRHCSVCDREKQNRQPAFVGQPRPPRITFSVVQHL